MSETVRYNLLINDEISDRLAKIDANFRSLEGTINQTNNRLSSIGKTSAISALASTANAAFTAGREIWGMAEAHVKTAGSMQSSMSALKVASGSTYEFGQNTKFLTKAIDDFSLPIESATRGFKQWTAATMNSKLKGDTARQVFEDISVATSSMGVDAEATEGIFLAMSQMMSKGSIQAEELRGQLGERLPGAFSIMAKTVGVSEKKLGEMMQKGELLSEEVLPKFAATLREQFGGGLKDSANNINTVLTRLDNLRVKGIMALTPHITEFLLKIEQIANYVQSLNFEPFMDLAKSWMQTFTPVLDSISRLTGGISGLSTTFKVLATVLQTFSIPMKLTMMAFQNLLIIIEAIANVSEALFNKEFSKIPDILKEQAVRMKDSYADTFKSIKDGYKDIWTDAPRENADTFTAAIKGGSRLREMLTGEKNKKASLKPTSGIASDGNLKEANANISGSNTRNISINIQNLIGQNTNNIKRDGEQQELDGFTKKLLMALQQEIVNVNLQYV
jgi:tape measure domain-containing protein